MQFQNTSEYAQQLDQNDALRSYRNEFLFPKVNGKEVIYFTGNSLGLQPKNAKKYVDEIMDDWAELGGGRTFSGRKALVGLSREVCGKTGSYSRSKTC